MSANHMRRALEMPGLTDSEKLVLIAFGDSADADTGMAYPSYSKMSKRIKKDRTSVIRATRALVRKGCLLKGAQVHRDGSSSNNVYVVLPDDMTAPIGWDEAAAAAGVTDEDIADFEAEDGEEDGYEGGGGTTPLPSDTTPPPTVTPRHHLVAPRHPVKGYITNKQTNYPPTPRDEDDGPVFVAGPADWSGMAADIRTAAGAAMSDRIPYPTALISIASDPDEAATTEDVLAAVRSARDYCLDKHGVGKMWSWKLALIKLPEVVARREATDARQAHQASDGKARQALSVRSSPKPKGQARATAADAAPLPEWAGPPDIRRAVVAALTEGVTRTTLDVAEWDGHVIWARTTYAVDKLRQVRALHGVARVELRRQGGAA